ncbi:VanZ family protein [Spirosoma sp. HMF4905]|uniref:VanZ family protein n=1 Tax=Spirosoma arboris TaxID=2682092 RepID=A0A7K1SB75_9BACT|nr:VanZ family protein [Spirosoma arboris]MVM31030.1 VanZ family protein [Spirosoma arboris]
MRIPPIVFRWLAIIWTIIMLIGCLTPHADLPGELVEFNDKILHAVIFAPFAILWILAGFRLDYVLIAGILFGGLIEGLQYILPINRTADWIDLAADGLGTLIGVGLAWVVQKTKIIA